MPFTSRSSTADDPSCCLRRWNRDEPTVAPGDREAGERVFPGGTWRSWRGRRVGKKDRGRALPASWREDYRRTSNGEQVNRLKRGKSVDFYGVLAAASR